MPAETSSRFFPNPFLCFFSGLILIGCTGVASDLSPSRAVVPFMLVWCFKILLVALPALIFIWLLSVRLVVDEEGLRYNSLFEKWRMQWEEIEEVYVEISLRLLNGVIPLGTTYACTIKSDVEKVDRHTKESVILGRKITSTSEKFLGQSHSIGSRFLRAEEAVTMIQSRTFPILWKRVSERYLRGEDVKFGAVGISRAGVWTSPLGSLLGFPKSQIPWSRIQRYELSKGIFRIFASDGKQLARIPSTEIANVSVMMKLLELAAQRREAAWN